MQTDGVMESEEGRDGELWMGTGVRAVFQQVGRLWFHKIGLHALQGTV